MGRNCVKLCHLNLTQYTFRTVSNINEGVIMPLALYTEAGAYCWIIFFIARFSAVLLGIALMMERLPIVWRQKIEDNIIGCWQLPLSGHPLELNRRRRRQEKRQGLGRCCWMGSPKIFHPLKASQEWMGQKCIKSEVKVGGGRFEVRINRASSRQANAVEPQIDACFRS